MTTSGQRADGLQVEERSPAAERQGWLAGLHLLPSAVVLSTAAEVAQPSIILPSRPPPVASLHVLCLKVCHMRLKGLLELQLAAQRQAAAGAAKNPPDSAPFALDPPEHGCWGAESSNEAAEAQMLAALAAANGWASGAAAGKRRRLRDCVKGRHASSQLSGGLGASSMSLASSRASEGEELRRAGVPSLRWVRRCACSCGGLERRACSSPKAPVPPSGPCQPRGRARQLVGRH